MNRLLRILRNIIAFRFDLMEDKAENDEIIESVKKGIDFRGANLWALIFAIIIASIGLNVNSTAVIIGAMLISPIMGPVMGIGLGIGTNDLEMVKRGAKNLLVATVISVVASSIYFTITPLHEAQSELLARTSPSIWDVFIAFFGGMAGMVAASRKEKNNVIPGVAIATALMPPLCTAGFAIAMGNLYFFLGAIYLYFINSVFIAIATYLMSRYIKLPKKHFEDPSNEKKVNRYMIIIVVVTILPSIYMAYRIVDKSIFENNAAKFVEEEFTRFTNTQVISKTYRYTRKQKSIDLLLIGGEIEKSSIDSMQKKLKDYHLSDVSLRIRQGISDNKEVDFSQIRASIMEEAFGQIGKRDSIVINQAMPKTPDSSVLTEIKTIYPNIKRFGTGSLVLQRNDTLKVDTLQIAIAQFSTKPNSADISKLQNWLRVRYKRPKLILQTNQ